jgi:beta-lactamase class A
MPRNQGHKYRRCRLIVTGRIGRNIVALAATVGLTASLAVATAPSAAASGGPTTRAVTSGVHALEARFRAYLAGRPGQVSVALYDARTGATANVTTSSRRGWETASTVKLDILAALLAKTGSGGRLTASQRALAKPMISVSDNAATSRLWRQLGGTAAMNTFFRRLGMTSTTAGAGGKWGLTRTTAADQLAVLRSVAYPNGVLSAAARATAAGLLRGVVPSQRWGLTAGVPSGVAVEIKNGWLPYDGGWVINSLAHVHGGGRDYVMAAYTRGSPSMAAGIQTVAGLSRIAWASGPVRR